MTMAPGTPHPSGDARWLIAGHLDGCLSAADEARLGALLATDRDVAVRLARAALVHDRLRDLFCSEMPPPTAASVPAAGVPATTARRWMARWVTALLAVALLGGMVLRSVVPSASAAGAAIDLLVAAAAAATDREYHITVLDHGPGGPPETVLSGGRGRKPGVDGARLYVRGADRFVLVRRFGDGSEFRTGSDGAIGWAVPPKGRVHLSHDARRFRRGVPGEHEEVPFIDMRSGLEDLRRGHDLALTTLDDGRRRLDAVRRPGRQRGPEEVRILFDAAGVATRIEIHGLPAEGGMPRSLALDLVSTADLGASFFGHEAHHADDRPLAWE